MSPLPPIPYRTSLRVNIFECVLMLHPMRDVTDGHGNEVHNVIRIEERIGVR